MTPPISSTAPPMPRTVRRAWLVIGGLVTVAVLGLGGFTAWQVISGSGMARHTEQSTITETGTPGTVSIHGTSANVELRGADVEALTADLDLIWYSAEPVIDTLWQGSDLLVELYCRSTGIPIWFLPECSIDYAAQMPYSTGADVELSSGSISVEDVDGDLDLHTNSGTIEGSDLTGSVYAHTVAGDISAAGLTSDAEVTTNSGHIWLEFSHAPSRIEAESDSGNVEVLVPRGESYRLLTARTMGEIDVQVATDPESEHIIDLRTDHGHITVEYTD